MTGKIDADALEAFVFGRTGAPAEVPQGAAAGEDAAAIPVGEELLVVSADPCSLAADRVGTLAVHVACNDVAASGGRPRWLTSTVLLPPADARATLDRVADQLDRAAREVGATIVGGHTETLAALDRPLCSMTAFGPADRFVPTAGASAGDRLLLTGGAGIEATAILATDFGDDLRGRGAVDDALLDRAAGFLDSVSVVPDAAALRPHATALHDPTEGGVLAGLVELARASGVRAVVERDAVPVAAETGALCRAAGVDPLSVFGSGALLAAVPDDRADAALDALADAGIQGAEIGRAAPPDDRGPGVALDGDWHAEVPRDDMYALWG